MNLAQYNALPAKVKWETPMPWPEQTPNEDQYGSPFDIEARSTLRYLDGYRKKAHGNGHTYSILSAFKPALERKSFNGPLK